MTDETIVSEALREIALEEGWIEKFEEISLYLWQEKAITMWAEKSGKLKPKHENDNDKEFFGIVAAVTGAGKTIYALECINVWLQKHPLGNVTVLVPTRVLVNQWRKHLSRAFQQPIGQLGGGRKNWQQINVSTMDTGARGFPATSKEHLIVVDECHNIGSDTRRYAILNNPHTAVLGLSATPEREDSGL
ncbi:MAG: DEAD/DEAH box helicase family protein, partial [Euryarchaeota archaeon]|nr:DEAD/DEAH box helicase family protein [Euryarchaeota archaeon]